MLLETVNPLLPTSYDVMWTVVMVAVLVLSIAALVQVLRSKALSGIAALVWVLVILALPVLGSIGWFVLRPNAALAGAQRLALARDDA